MDVQLAAEFVHHMPVVDRVHLDAQAAELAPGSQEVHRFATLSSHEALPFCP